VILVQNMVDFETMIRFTLW